MAQRVGASLAVVHGLRLEPRIIPRQGIASVVTAVRCGHHERGRVPYLPFGIDARERHCHALGVAAGASPRSDQMRFGISDTPTVAMIRSVNVGVTSAI